MKDINNYIIEKLKINKDIDSSADYKKVIDEILYGYGILGQTKDKLNEYQQKTYDIVSAWVNDNDVTEVVGYAERKKLYSAGLEEKIIKKYKDILQEHLKDKFNNCFKKEGIDFSDEITNVQPNNNWHTEIKYSNSTLLVKDYNTNNAKIEYYFGFIKNN